MPLVEKAFQHGHLLTLKQGDYDRWVASFLREQVREDLKNLDLTSATLFPNSTSPMKSEIVAKEDGVMAGLEELGLFCRLYDIRLTALAQDGQPVHAGEKVAELEAPVRTLLETERVGLDLIGRMSGIATQTAALTAQAQKRGGTRVSATRKTLCGPMDKKAVFLGGGLTHRLGLWQAILIKENHLVALRNTLGSDPFEEAMNRVASRLPNESPAFVEIETETPQDALRVGELFVEKLAPFPDIPKAVLLDNFSADSVAETVRSFEEKGWREQILLEASGGITRENLNPFVEAGVDLVSVGALTHSVRNLDFSQRFLFPP